MLSDSGKNDASQLCFLAFQLFLISQKSSVWNGRRKHCVCQYSKQFLFKGYGISIQMINIS